MLSTSAALYTPRKTIGRDTLATGKAVHTTSTGMRRNHPSLPQSCRWELDWDERPVSDEESEEIENQKDNFCITANEIPEVT